MANKQTDKLLISQSIEPFLTIVNKATTTYQYATQQMKKCDDATQDCLHKIELDDSLYEDRARTATQLRTIRQDRRYYKNTVETLEPIITFLENPQNKKAVDILTNVLGKIRKVESYHNNRCYIPKVIKLNENK